MVFVIPVKPLSMFGCGHSGNLVNMQGQTQNHGVKDRLLHSHFT